jgi:hypothetical protein
MRTNKKRVASSSVITLTILCLALFNGCTPSGPQAVPVTAQLRLDLSNAYVAAQHFGSVDQQRCLRVCFGIQD